jgi:hypothetical protein
MRRKMGGNSPYLQKIELLFRSREKSSVKMAQRMCHSLRIPYYFLCRAGIGKKNDRLSVVYKTVIYSIYKITILDNETAKLLNPEQVINAWGIRKPKVFEIKFKNATRSKIK